MTTMEPNPPYLPDSNYTQDFYLYNESYYNESFDYEHYLHARRQAAIFDTMDFERRRFVYVYHAFAGCIVLFNLLVAVAILISRKQRKHFHNWLILHMTILHILYGAISLPFLAQLFTTTGAGLGSNAVCKLLNFITDVLNYMANISTGILGFYQCITVVSPRLLKSVSNALLVSIMIILPWFVVFMLTAVLRLTMSEEQYGQCYIVSDKTAIILWFLFSKVLPMTLISACFITMVTIACFKYNLNSSTSRNERRYDITVFVSICLALCIAMRLPFYIVFFEPVTYKCITSLGNLFCSRVIYGLDTANLASMVLIPLAYLIPKEVIKRCRKFKARLLCKTVDCSSNKKKQQTMEMVSIQSTDRSLL
ncbi:uncharacterized protein LOC128231857 isoform X2 [Mya arenaria]|nr:uncharacterized protein LOC128231857 isoform X2 [Mya arenaria]